MLPLQALLFGLIGGVVPRILGEAPPLHRADGGDGPVQKGGIVGHRQEGPLQPCQRVRQPRCLLLVQKVGGLVQQQHVRLLQQQPGQEQLGPLAAAQFPHRAVQPQLRQPQSRRRLLHTGVHLVKPTGLQLLLPPGRGGQGRPVALRRPVVQLCHGPLQRVEGPEGPVQHLPHSVLRVQGGILVQAAHPDTALPHNPPPVGHQLAGTQLEQGALSCSVPAHHAYVLPPVEGKGSILKQRLPAKGVGQPRDLQQTHGIACHPF